MAPAHLRAAEFERLARDFAARFAASRPVAWAWVEAPSCNGPFALPPTGYLRSSPLMLAESLRPQLMLGTPVDVDGTVEAAGDVTPDEFALPLQSLHEGRLELHIVHNASYGAPVLLLQGYSAEGVPWTVDDTRNYLHDGAGSGLGLSSEMVSQMEHPALGVPFCCLHPCRTPELMGELMGSTAVAGVGVDSAQLDYLTAWWAVLAPVVGVSHSRQDYARLHSALDRDFATRARLEQESVRP